MPTTITMPALSPTMTEGTLAKWLVKEGDNIAAGDVLAEIETDKATMEVEAVDEGTLGRILVEAGTENVAVNAPIAVLLEEGEDQSALEGYQPKGGPALKGDGEAAPAPRAEAAAAPQAAPQPAPQAAAAQPEAASQEPAGKAPPAPRNADGKRVPASPLARRMAAQAGLDLMQLSGSGPNGRIVKADIEAALQRGEARRPAAEAPRPAPVAPPAGAEPYEPEFELQPLTSFRRAVARRMSESKQTVPHFYLTLDCEIDALLKLRQELNAKASGFKLSVNDMLIKAAAIALTKVPAANAGYTEGGIKLYKSCDVSVAVATERGLITPVIRHAEAKGMEAISREMRELGLRARDGKLKPEDYLGGSFSLSNLGMYGIKQFEAVINPPQACILAVGAGEQRAVVKDGALVVATVMSCTLSVDHRAVDGAIGAEWLAAFKRLVEDPMTMLL